MNRSLLSLITCVLLLLNVYLTSALASDLTEKCREYGLALDVEIGSCDNLEKRISAETVNKIIKDENMKAEKNPPIIIKSCQEIWNDIESEKFEEIISKFEKNIREWQESDFTILSDALINCVIQSYYIKSEKKRKEYIEKTLDYLRKEHDTEVFKFAILKAKDIAIKEKEKSEKREKEKLHDSISRKHLNTSPEAGWKNLKWGMNFAEVKAVYCIDDPECEKNIRLSTSRITMESRIYISENNAMKLYQQVSNMFQDVFIDQKATGIMLFNGELFGVKKNVGKSYFERGGAENIDQVIKDLKIKYPKGNVIIRKINNGKYPVFEYESDNIKIFTNYYGEIYFYNPIALKLIKNYNLKEDKKKTEEEQESLKKLF